MMAGLDAVEIVHDVQHPVLDSIEVIALIVQLIEHSVFPAMTCGGAECTARCARFELIAIVRVFRYECHDLCMRGRSMR